MEKMRNKGENKPQEPLADGEGKMLSELETLEEEWDALSEEKRRLEDAEKTLRQRVKKEIEVRKQRIDRKKNEIFDLKQRCETLAKLLDINLTL